MKKCIFILAFLGLMPVVSAFGYEYQDSSTQYTTTRAGSKSYKRTNTVRKVGGYHNTINNNFYYGQPPVQQQQRPVVEPEPMVREYAEQEPEPEYVQPVVKTERKEEKKVEYTTQTRKYFLAHPFFQPLKGSLGSVTDIAYAKNNFKFNIQDGTFYDLDVPVPTGYEPFVYGTVDVNGKASASQLLVKEDISFGLTDNLALMLMAQYDKTKVNIGDWDNNEPSNKVSHSGLNLFGIGLQSRFVDNDEWIAMASGFFQHQKDTANTFIVDLKAGYKISKTTVYGLARLGYTSLIDAEMYGMLWDDPSGDWLALTYNTDVKDVFYLEGGAGFFSVLNKYMYMGGELIYGYYDWHNQLNIKGTIGFQPSDSFALSLYASTSLYDSAKNKVRKYINYDVNPDPVVDNNGDPVTNPNSTKGYTVGDYKIKNYNEWKIGVQAILYF